MPAVSGSYSATRRKEGAVLGVMAAGQLPGAVIQCSLTGRLTIMAVIMSRVCRVGVNTWLFSVEGEVNRLLLLAAWQRRELLTPLPGAAPIEWQEVIYDLIAGPANPRQYRTIVRASSTGPKKLGSLLPRTLANLAKHTLTGG